MKFIVIPAKDEESIRQVEIAGKKMTLDAIREHSNIHYFEIVKTQDMLAADPQSDHNNHLVALVDEDGHQKRLAHNFRAMAFMNYLGGPIVGDVIITRIGWADDGYDCVTVQDGDFDLITGIIAG